MDLMSMLGIKQLSFDSLNVQLTAKETAKIEELRARRLEIFRSLSDKSLIGLSEPSEQLIAFDDAITDEANELASQIWERADPGQELRKAHFNQEMARVKADMEEQYKNQEQGCHPDCEEDCSSYEGEKVSLLSRIKQKLFG